MSIRDFLLKIKAIMAGGHVFPVLLIVVVGIASFGLGRLSVFPQNEAGKVIDATPLTAENVTESAGPDVIEGKNSDISGVPIEGGYVASKNSDRYHLPWCSGAQRISDENKIWFATKEEAEAAGYKPAGNCPGI